MEKRQLFHVKNVCKNVKNGRMDFLVIIIELLRFLHCTLLSSNQVKAIPTDIFWMYIGIEKKKKNWYSILNR